MYSVTDEITADEITALMVERIGNDKKLAIADATACVGGNLFSFARHYTKVLGINRQGKIRDPFIIGMLFLVSIRKSIQAIQTHRRIHSRLLR